MPIDFPSSPTTNQIYTYGDRTWSYDGTTWVAVNDLSQKNSFSLGSETTPSIKFTGDDDTGIYSPGADQISVTTGGTERVAVDSSGRVGIGTSLPSRNLTVSNGTNAIIAVQNSGQSTEGVFNAPSGGTINLGTTGSYDLTLSTNSLERVRIDSSGRLLAGASSTTWTHRIVAQGGVGFTAGSLAIARAQAGSAIGSGGDIGYLSFGGNDNTTFAQISAWADGTTGSNDYPGRLVFSTTANGASSPTERMRITNDGKMRIGMGNFGSDPSASNGGTQFKDESTGHIITAATVATTTNHHIFFNTNGVVGSIQTNGSATSFNTSSDYRLKENVVDIADGISRVKQLQPKRFNFIADDTTTLDGFIAHEVQDVIPEAISGNKDAVDDEGNPIYQGIDQSKLVPLLTAALQEAIAKIETLEAQNASLEARLTALEGGA